jgi:hypothetical protein
MLSNAGMSRHFWAEVASTAYYVINRSPSIPLNKKTPIEVWSVTPADYLQLRVFGCTTYAHVDNGKLEPREVKCVFLGYGLRVKAYKLWNPKTKMILMRRNVVFNDTVMFTDSLMMSNRGLACRWSTWRRKEMLKMMMLIMNLGLMIFITILFHPYHLFRSNKVILLQMTVQGEPLLLVSVKLKNVHCSSCYELC